MKFFTVLISLLVVTSSFSQRQADEMMSMFIHLNVKGNSAEKSFVKNLKDQEAIKANIPAFLAEHEGAHVRIFGNRKNTQDLVGYQFDSKKLNDNPDCDGYCEKIVNIERVPFLGLGVSPMDDFSGVVIDNIVEGTSGEEAGLQVGDVITAIQNFEISSACDLSGAVNEQEVEDYVAVEYVRDGKPNLIYLTIGYRVKKNITWVKCCEKDEEIVPEQIFEDLSLAVYPNPTSGITQFNFQTTKFAKATLQLTDMAGRSVLNKTLFPIDGYLNDYLDLSKIASGVYILNIQQEGKTISERIVLQRE